MTVSASHKQELVTQIQKMTLMDDIFFNNFMDNNPEAMEYILNIIMERNDLHVVRLQTQHGIPNIYGRSVRFDVFATDQNGSEYNFEVQNANHGADPKRARYNSSMMDYQHLSAGQNFSDLPQTYVIFITARDVLGHNLPIYHIRRYISELALPFLDNTNIIYVNGETNDNSPLGMLMQDFKQADAHKMKSKILASRMNYLKSTNEEVTKMSQIVEEYAAKRVAEAKLEGKLEGKLIGIAETMKNIMKNNNWSAEKALTFMGIPQNEQFQYLKFI